MENLFQISTYASKNDACADMVEAGRSLVREYMAKNVKANTISMHSDVNAFLKNVEVDSYQDHNATLLKSILAYAAKPTGYACENFADFQNRQLTTDPTFIARFDNVVSQILNPIIPDIVSEAFMGLADVSYVGYGDTADLHIDSNETFYVKEIAEGVQRGAMQRLYKNEATINPTPKQIRIELPWYEVVSGKFDLGNWLYRVGISFAGYINAKVIASVTDALKTIPTAYQTSGAFTDSNFLGIGQRVSAANGGKLVQVWGTKMALGRVLPDKNLPGLYYGLGVDVARVGFLGMYKGFPLIEMAQAIKPGTVNTTADLLLDDQMLYFIPVDSYNPIKVVFEGDSVTVEKEANKSSDKYLGLAITMRIGVAAVVGSIFGSYKVNA